MEKIAFINSKGGCGKSTSLFHIAGVLADNELVGAECAEKKVLAIDLDKQGDTTYALLSEDESNYNENDKNVFDFLKGDASFDEVVKKAYIRRKGNSKPVYVGIDVLPFSPKLENQKSLKDIDLIDKMDGLNEYDYVLIDCPPSNRAIEKIVFEQLADSILVPMSSDLDSIRGYGELVEKVDKAREHNPNLRILGIYMAMYDKRRRLHRDILDMMKENFDIFIDVQLPLCSALPDARINGRPISFWKKSTAKDAVEELVQEIMYRI